uniref:GIY-YIG domain-containing protein n=1 Tax=Octopus bimaculoides TaxID=37653 RepID=A0A0L8FN69_OCTBM
MSIKCTLCNQLYVGQTGRRLANRFTEHLRDVRLGSDSPVGRYFQLANHSPSNISVFGLALHHGSTPSRLHLEQRYIFNLNSSFPFGLNAALSSL